MSGGLLQLIGYGANDAYLAGYSKVIDLSYKIITEIKENECPYCLQEYAFGEKIHITNCGHVIHYDCLLEYLTRSKKEEYNCLRCTKTIVVKYKYEKVVEFVDESKNYFDYVQPYQHHYESSDGIKEYREYTFSLVPEMRQPSGHCNLSRLMNF